MAFTVEPDGSFRNIRVLSSSGNRELDATAIRAIRALNGNVKRPEWSGRQPIDAVLVVKYQHEL
jgi:TonB family protein